MPTRKQSVSFARSLTCSSTALALVLLIAGCDRDAGDPEPSVTSTANAAGSSSQANEPLEALAARRRTLIADAAEALDETYAALGLLARQDNEGASEALARATGKLEVVLTAEPDLALAPVAVDIRTYDLIATPDDVNALRRIAEEALDDGRLQEGRVLIEDLASEHVLSVTSLPLATYPDALAQAAALIQDRRPQDAILTLEAALATLVIEETIMPLPLIRAELFLDRARPVAEQAARSPEEAEVVRLLLAEARRQLDLASALGYGTRSDLDDLYDAIEEIEDETANQGSARGLFDRLKGLFDSAERSTNEEGGRPPPGQAAAGGGRTAP